MSVEIKYNGNTIASVESGKIATIPCKGKKMAGNIVVKGDGDIKYKGETLATLSNGQTATIPCKGKIMQDNIVIKASGMPKPTDLTGTTWKVKSLNCTAGQAIYNVDFIVETLRYPPDGLLEGTELGIGYSSYDFESMQFSQPTANSVNVGAPYADYIDIGDEITITGGDDVSKNTLIDWLYENATLQVGSSLITFTINDTTYYAEEGMTWGEWIGSGYNTDGFKAIGIYVYHKNGATWVATNDREDQLIDYVIVSNKAYLTTNK